MRMNKMVLFTLLLVSIATTILFQNCGKPQSGSSTGLVRGLQKVIGQTSAYTKIIFQKQQEKFDRTGPLGTQLSLDLLKGSLSIGTLKNGVLDQASLKSCLIDDTRLGRLNSLLSTSRVCIPGPLPANSNFCMATSIPDIHMSNDSGTQSVDLASDMCQSGVFLCDNDDEILRTSLADLIAKPPQGCLPQ